MEMSAPTPRWMARHSRLRLAPAMAMILLTGLLSACATAPAPVPQASATPAPAPQLPPRAPQMVEAGPALTGTASWYKPGPHLHRTCTGEPFTRGQLTAASPSIPVGTQVRVALLDDDSRSVIVRVNDCMPHGHRILDLSEGAAEQLGLLDLGVARVSVTPVLLVDNR